MAISSTGFWLDDNLDNHRYDEPLAQELLAFFKNEKANSIVDFGCGHGNYTKLLGQEINTDGFDGNPNTVELTNGLCSVLDLSQPVDLNREYDWVLSLEVGEHIPKEYETTFIYNLHRHNTKGIVLSWAIPGQGGHGHFNEQSNEYITEKFTELGYVRDQEKETVLRNSSTFFWFKNTIMVFRKAN